MPNGTEESGPAAASQHPQSPALILLFAIICQSQPSRPRLEADKGRRCSHHMSTQAPCKQTPILTQLYNPLPDE